MVLERVSSALRLYMPKLAAPQHSAPKHSALPAVIRPSSRTRHLWTAAVLVVVCGFGPMTSTAAAQDDKVYTMAELSNPPKLASATSAAKLIQDSYPEDLKRRKVGGLVELQFVVDAQGNVVAGSVEVVDATQTALGEAAKKVITRFTFEPGKLNGNKVKSKVVLPIVYKVME